MIRLSNLTAIDILQTEFTEDLSVDKLFLYKHPTEQKYLFVKDDSYKLRQMSRNNATATFWGNVLLGTSNYYPEQGLDLTNFHTNHEITNLINFSDVPMMQYKRANLYFSQGSLANNRIVAHYIRIYVATEDNAIVDCFSVLDFANDSNIKAKTSKLFENQIFNEALELSFPDIEYIVNSSNSEIVKLKKYLFGDRIPRTYFIEYAAITSDMLDDFSENGLLFTELNLGVVNSNTSVITEEANELRSSLYLTNDNYSIVSVLMHTKFDVEAFIKSNYKINDEEFELSHIVSTSEYDETNALINQTNVVLSNPVAPYAPMHIRPLFDVRTNHAMIDVTIKIKNLATSMTISKSSSLLIKEVDIDKFKSTNSVVLDVEHQYINQTINKTVNQIVQENKSPKILYFEKKIWVQSSFMGGPDLAIYDADMYVKLAIDNESTFQSEKTYLKLGNEIIESQPNQPLMFFIPQAYYSKLPQLYLLLDESLTLIQQGKIIKDAIPKIKTN